jgi:hypothetical protein
VVDDLPSPALFEETVGRLARDLVIASEGLTAFGEMVALLWAQGNKRGALELEDLWNRLLDQSTFHLHCAYPKVLFAGDENDLRDVCDHHSLLIGLGSA